MAMTSVDASFALSNRPRPWRKSVVLHLPPLTPPPPLLMESLLETHQKNLWVMHLAESPQSGAPPFGGGLDCWPAPVEVHTQPGTVPLPGSDVRMLKVTPEWLETATRCWRHHQHWMPHLGLLVVQLPVLENFRLGFLVDSAVSRLCRINPLLQTLVLAGHTGTLSWCSRWLDAEGQETAGTPVTALELVGLSSLSHHMEEWVLSEVASTSACTFDSLSRAHLRTLDGAQGPALEALHVALRNLMERELVQKRGPMLQVTPVGHRVAFERVA